MTLLLLQLFATFFIIGLFNFGGGGAMIALIQTQVVDVRGWLTEPAFTDIVAISQTTPGPIGINCATYVGYRVMSDSGFGSLAGVLGSFASTLAVVLPSFLIFLVLVKLFDRFHKHPVFISTMSALKPVVAGLIFTAAIILTFHIGFGSDGLEISVIRENFPDWKSWALAAAAFASVYFLKASPIIVILAGALLGLIIY